MFVATIHICCNHKYLLQLHICVATMHICCNFAYLLQLYIFVAVTWAASSTSISQEWLCNLPALQFVGGSQHPPLLPDAIKTKSKPHAGRRIKFARGKSLDSWNFSSEFWVLGNFSSNVKINPEISWNGHNSFQRIFPFKFSAFYYTSALGAFPFIFLFLKEPFKCLWEILVDPRLQWEIYESTPQPQEWTQ